MNNYVVFKDGTQRVKGRYAFERNVEAIKAVADAIQSSLGPKGLNKMIVDTLGDVIITGDGAQILEEMQIENPAAKMFVDFAKSISKNYGDGVTSAVVFMGALMRKAEDLISMNLAPMRINDGFRKAYEETKSLIESYQIKIDSNDKDILRQIALTAMNSKGLEDSKAIFANIIIKALDNIAEIRGNSLQVDLDNIQFIKKEGEPVKNTQFVEGVIIDKEIVYPMMPRIVKNAKIALIDGALEIIKTNISSEVAISSPSVIQDFLSQEKQMIQEMVDAIQKSGANVVFCQKGIDETAQNFLYKRGILAVRRVKNSDMKKLARATGADIITQIKSITIQDLGSAKKVSQKSIGSDNMIFIEGCSSPKAITVLIRGSTEIIVDNAERSLKNALSAVKNTLEHPYIIPGGGSIEVQLRKGLLEYAERIGGKEQLAIEQYADALEIIPRLLIENSGKDPLDLLTELRSKVDYSKNQLYGYDAYSGQIVDVKTHGILEPAHIKRNILAMATELAIVFIRVDEYIKSATK
jgi:thermosome